MEVLSYPILLILFTCIFTLEVIAPVSKNSCDRRWLLIASIIGFFQMAVSLAVGYLFRDWFLEYSLMNLSEIAPGFIVGLIAFNITSLIFYWWHRLIHENGFLWRTIHQLHHSSQRIESITAFYAHPLDSGMATLISCLSAYLILGATTEAAAWAILYTGLFNFYVHSDTKSPYWIGYIIQRPEMHRVHHERGSHSHNYGLPIWDILFGTYRNPKTDIRLFGFSDNKANRIYDMLRGVDVHKTSANTINDNDIP